MPKNATSVPANSAKTRPASDWGTSFGLKRKARYRSCAGADS